MKKSLYKNHDFFQWFKNNFTILIIVILLTYLFFAFLAPFLMSWGFPKAGIFIYSIYGKFCHQFAHRSWFLFGEQSFYPITVVDYADIKSLQDVFGISAGNLQKSREVIGNISAGYKVAICQRDVMIYFSLLVSAFIFYFSHNKIQKIPFWIWFLFAVIPMGIDGLWQFLSTINLFDIPNYESTPLIRSLSGGLFGLFSGWYLLPAIQDTFNDEDKGIITNRIIEKR